MSSGHKKRYLSAARRSLLAQGKVLPTPQKVNQNWEEIAKTRLNFDVKKCPCCGQQTMVKVGIIPAQPMVKIKKERAPPLISLSSLPRVDLDNIQF